MNTMEVREDDEEFQNQVDLMFADLEKENPEHFAVRQYKKYKLAAGVVCSKRLLNQAVGKSLRTHNRKYYYLKLKPCLCIPKIEKVYHVVKSRLKKLILYR